jgi:uncharacterized protein (UPF0335 family)
MGGVNKRKEIGVMDTKEVLAFNLMVAIGRIETLEKELGNLSDGIRMVLGEDSHAFIRVDSLRNECSDTLDALKDAYAKLGA